jgi:SAM-dependent methyltransferase
VTVAADAGAYGAQFADFYDRLFPRDAGAQAAVEYLATLHLRDAGPPLELGVGTGRIAIPLAARVGEVVGVDASPEMLDRLAAEPSAVRPVLGDMRTYADEGDHGLVYCVLGSLSIVLDRDEQRAAVAAFAEAAAPGAAVVIETHNPAPVLALHEGRRTETMFVPYPEPDTALLSHSTLDGEHGLWRLSHVFFDGGRARIATELSRLIDPDELDAYAREAGLRREARHGDWRGTPARGDEPMVVSTYRRDP